MARVPPADGTGEVADRIRRRRNGELTPLDDVLLHSAPLADGWNSLLGAVRTGLNLPDDLRELVILRVAALTGAGYEWRAHEPLARAAGLSDDQVRALGEDGDSTSLTPTQRACVAYADAMTRAVQVPEALFAEVLRHLGEQRTVELTGTIATYNLVARFLLAMGIEPESS
ncbi:MAG TPA: carboxymuconolactone decarboxylase family protein [Jiangellales bacterium]|nr:carboxymuconolactone decarboxylase family protein [Jiangellales bacterium]